MGAIIDGRTPTTEALGARSPQGQSILSLLAKRTYRFDSAGRIDAALEQLPLRVKPEYDGNGPQCVLLGDLELYPFKLLTDVVIRGNVYGYGQRTVDATISIGRWTRTVRAMGDRQVGAGFMGRPVFSEPAPFEQMPLRYDRAYGGRDDLAETRYPNLFRKLAPNLPAEADVEGYSLCVYPRNRHGRGYLLTDDARALARLSLPNIEDPRRLLTPDTLLVRDPYAWWRQPMPTGTGWLHHSYFARMIHIGAKPHWRPLDDALDEFTWGYIPKDARDLDASKLDARVFRLQNGASLGLQMPYLPAGTPIELTKMHPQANTIRITVPEPPILYTRTRWRQVERAEPVLHHIEVQPDENIFTVVWRGAIDIPRALMPDELDALPFRTEWMR